MTTAARPTYVPARGGTGKSENDLGALSKQYSSRDLPAHTKLKYRQDGQNTLSDLKSRDFRKELEDRERSGRDKGRGGDRGRDSGTTASSSSSTSASKKPRLDQLPVTNLDADDPVDEDEDENEVESDDEDDTAELLAELAKIKKERAAEAAQKEIERKAEEERIRMENIIKGNPLINQERQMAEFKVKRRWDDDVVFKNCTRGESDKKERRFVNDTLRSDFHKKFMEKYIK